MTETTKTIFEKYEIRKTKAQKSAFITFVQAEAEKLGYSCRTEKGWLGARNIVVGDPETAKVVYTAHYDTCPVMPFPNFITPRHLGIYLLYQIAMVMVFMLVPMIAVMVLFQLAAAALEMEPDLAVSISVMLGYGVMLAFLAMLLCGPANRHTANDNTSGVTVLLDIMQALPENHREDTAFIFFDLEESGLFGSGGYYSRHKKTMKQKLLINFDCVSDGEHILLAVQKKAEKYIPVLQKAFVKDENVQVEIISKGVFYPSDQMNFPCGVGAASLKQWKKSGILYMDRIHTAKDTVYREENIAYLTAASLRLAELFSEE